jgi:poly-gamma-glutamate synthase PgsB/CapB
LNIVLAITIATLIFLIAERFVIARRTGGIRYRIHVNGTRGKSSVARYIGAALSAASVKTVVKVTGVIPTLYFSDGSSHPIKRWGKARVQEQLSVISRAFAHRADALVMECMSLKPEYQQLESRLFRPNVSVITNIEDDHREEMGITHQEHVESIAASLPYHSLVFTIDMEQIDLLKRIADDRGTSVHVVAPLDAVLAAQLPAGMFAANVSLALAVASHCGIDKDKAFTAIKELGSQKECIETTINGFPIRFINGFAVNDVPSAVRFIDRWSDGNTARKKIIILNTRNDRPLRTVEFVHWCASVKDLHHCFITGTHASYALRTLKKTTLAGSRFSRVGVEELSGKLNEIVQSEMDIFGFGNIAGDGFSVIEYFTMKDAA